MPPRRDGLEIKRSWTNGEKASVHLVLTLTGEQQVLKVYRPGFNAWMLREWLAMRHLCRRNAPVPRLLRFRPLRREILMAYVPGERVLEWTLREFGGPSLDLAEFQNSDELYTDPRILAAFERLKASPDPKAMQLKAAVKNSYRQLHTLGWQHGTGDPRNVIYDGVTACLIDFDHARPSLKPGSIDGKSLFYWYGFAVN